MIKIDDTFHLEMETKEGDCLREIPITNCYDSLGFLLLGERSKGIESSTHFEDSYELLIFPLKKDIAMMSVREFEGSLERSS